MTAPPPAGQAHAPPRPQLADPWAATPAPAAQAPAPYPARAAGPAGHPAPCATAHPHSTHGQPPPSPLHPLPIEDLTSILQPTTPYARRRPRDIHALVIHHTAGPRWQPAADIHRYHQSKGWRGIGYHYLIYPDGRVVKTRPILAIPACVHRHNHSSICIALTGHFGREDPTDAQLDAAIRLAALLITLHPTIGLVAGHREMPGQATDCPGWRFPLQPWRTAVMRLARLSYPT